MLILCRFVVARREAVFFLSDEKHQKHTKIWAKSGVRGRGGMRESGEFQEFLFVPPLPTRSVVALNQYRLWFSNHVLMSPRNASQSHRRCLTPLQRRPTIINFTSIAAATAARFVLQQQYTQ